MTPKERTEDVIFWALEHYANSEPKGTLGRTIAYAIKERILEAEKIDADSGAVGKNKNKSKWKEYYVQQFG